VIQKYAVRTSKGTWPATIIKTNWLMLYTEMVAVYCKSRTELHQYPVERIQMF